MIQSRRRHAGRAGIILLLASTAATSAQTPPPATPAPAKPAPAKIEQVRKARAEGLLGQPVMDANGDVFGHVIDILIDADGTPHAAVIEFTGFFGIGNRRVAVAWNALQFKTQQDHIAIVAPLDIPKLKAMPEYTQDENSVPVATPTVPAPKKEPDPNTGRELKAGQDAQPSTPPAGAVAGRPQPQPVPLQPAPSQPVPSQPVPPKQDRVH